MGEGKLSFQKMAKNDLNGMIKGKWGSMLLLGVVSWFGVSKDHVVKITKYQGHRNFLGLGFLEDLEMASIWAYKGGGLKLAQMGLLPKDEV